MTRSKILATAYVVPERVVTSKGLANSLDISSDKVLAISGVKERRFVEEGEGNVSMAKQATQQALEALGMDAGEIEMIVCSGSYPDHQFPGTSAFLQRELGLEGCAILDVRSQGTGFLTALSTADQFIRSGQYKRILIVGSDVHSTGLQFEPGAEMVTSHFGDGAGVAILGPSDDENTGVLSVKLHTDGRYAKDWYIPLGSIQKPRILPENLARGDQYPVIHWDVINRETLQRIPEAIAEACDEAGVAVADLDFILAPNFSSVLIRRLYKAAGIAEDKFLSVKHRFGDTGCGGIPIGWNVAINTRKLKAGKLFAAVAVGSGFTYGAAVIRW